MEPTPAPRIAARTWIPSKSAHFGFRVRPTLAPNKLVRYNYRRLFNQITFYSLAQRRIVRVGTSLVIAVDGACRGNNRSDPTSRASYGVYFGPDSPYNTYGLVPRQQAQTSVRAELAGADSAVKIVESMMEMGQLVGIKHVILKSDSDWLCKSLREWVWVWEEKGGLNSRGKMTEHWPVIQDLHERIKRVGERGVNVRFWWVERRFNREADGLANKALDVGGTPAGDSGYETNL